MSILKNVEVEEAGKLVQRIVLVNLTLYKISVQKNTVHVSVFFQIR